MALIYVRKLKSLVQIMACRLVGSKPIFEPMPDIVNSKLRNKLQGNNNWTSHIYIKENTFKCRLENGGCFVSASMCLEIRINYTLMIPTGMVSVSNVTILVERSWRSILVIMTPLLRDSLVSGMQSASCVGVGVEVLQRYAWTTRLLTMHWYKFPWMIWISLPIKCMVSSLYMT